MIDKFEPTNKLNAYFRNYAIKKKRGYKGKRIGDFSTLDGNILSALYVGFANIAIPSFMPQAPDFFYNFSAAEGSLIRKVLEQGRVQQFIHIGGGRDDLGFNLAAGGLDSVIEINLPEFNEKIKSGLVQKECKKYGLQLNNYRLLGLDVTKDDLEKCLIWINKSKPIGISDFGLANYFDDNERLQYYENLVKMCNKIEGECFFFLAGVDAEALKKEGGLFIKLLENKISSSLHPINEFSDEFFRKKGWGIFGPGDTIGSVTIPFLSVFPMHLYVKR